MFIPDATWHFAVHLKITQLSIPEVKLIKHSCCHSVLSAIRRAKYLVRHEREREQERAILLQRKQAIDLKVNLSLSSQDKIKSTGEKAWNLLQSHTFFA